jgi:hypothetical protein
MIDALSDYLCFFEKANLRISEQINLLIYDLTEEQYKPEFSLFGHMRED